MTRQVRAALALIWGAVIGTLGGLIGLGGAEFRLPVLIGLFRFAALEAGAVADVVEIWLA
jgi:uncharacterized membrane protein YfcA